MAVSTGTAILGSAAIGALAPSILGGRGGNTTSTQSSAPWGPSQPGLIDIYNKGQDQYYRNYYNGGVTPGLQQATDLQRQRGLLGSPVTRAAQDQTLSTIRGDYLDLSKNPAAQSAMDMARSKINSQFSGDNFGNSAHQEWLGKGLLSAASPFYESERQRQMGASAIAPSIANQDYVDIGNVAQANQSIDQAPWNNLFNYQRAMSSGNGGTTTTQQPYFNNPMATGLGLGLGGLGLYNGLSQGGLLGGGMNMGGPMSSFGMTGGTF